MKIPLPSITHSVVGAIGAITVFTTQLFAPNPITVSVIFNKYGELIH